MNETPTLGMCDFHTANDNLHGCKLHVEKALNTKKYWLYAVLLSVIYTKHILNKVNIPV